MGRGTVAALLLAGLACLHGCRAPARPTPRRITVEISGMAFSPARVEASPGDTIVWINRDLVPHTATAAGTWDTGAIARGDSARVVVTRGGDWVCTFHPTMRGTLVLP